MNDCFFYTVNPVIVALHMIQHIYLKLSIIIGAQSFRGPLVATGP